jgi:hypothetical protein
VGCGTGDFARWYRASGGSGIRYCGIDSVPPFLDRARQLHPESEFALGDALALERVQLPAPDVIVISGLFNLAGPAPERFFRRVIRACFSITRRGVAFNRITDRVDFRAPHLHYSSPESTLRFALGLSRRAVLRHDYPLFEYTVYSLRS